MTGSSLSTMNGLSGVIVEDGTYSIVQPKRRLYPDGRLQEYSVIAGEVGARAIDPSGSLLAYVHDSMIVIRGLPTGDRIDSVIAMKTNFKYGRGALLFSRDSRVLYIFFVTTNNIYQSVSYRYRYDLANRKIESLPGSGEYIFKELLSFSSLIETRPATSADPDVVWIGRSVRWNIKTGATMASPKAIELPEDLGTYVGDVVGDDAGNGYWIQTSRGVAHASLNGVVDRFGVTSMTWPAGFRSLPTRKGWQVGSLALSPDGSYGACVEVHQYYDDRDSEYVIAVWDLRVMRVVQRFRRTNWNIDTYSTSPAPIVVFDGVDSKALYTLENDQVCSWRLP